MGTMLYAKGVFLNRSFDELNLTQPDLVAEVHQAYVRAGADVIETNTFGANRIKLATFGVADQVHAINLQGARIARHAAREHTYVAGALGPLGIRIEPWGKTGVDEAEAFFREQAQALLEGGVDLFILETFRDVKEISAAIRAVRSLTDLPIVAQVTTEEEGNTLDGVAPESFVPDLEQLGAGMVGVNCSVGPAAMLETIERMAQVATLKLAAQPNAGRPREVEGRNLYLSSPEYMASYARRFINNGVRLVGGCCGTTPDHIRHIKTAVRALAPAEAPRERRGTQRPPVPESAPVPYREKSRMAAALERGDFVVSVELEPPRGFVADALVGQARELRANGVELVNIPDGPRSGARMSALSACVTVQQQSGIEPILHYACRDRNLLGMQSDLLGAHSLGIRNVLLVTGDPEQVGDLVLSTAVFDVDSIGLTNVVARLNRGLDIGGQPIGAATAFHIGVAVNPGAFNVDDEIRRFQHKVAAGAEFAITQPVFDVGALRTFLERTAHVRIPVIAAIAPLESLRHAELLANEVPGMLVPEAIVERMRVADANGRAEAEGLSIACEIATEVRGLVRGVQLAPAAGSLHSSFAVMRTLAECSRR